MGKTKSGRMVTYNNVGARDCKVPITLILAGNMSNEREIKLKCIGGFATIY